MEQTMETKTEAIITPQELIAHWQGHRGLTRRLIEAFPEKEFFSFSVGGMRTFAELIGELLAIGAPGMKQIATGEVEALNEKIDESLGKSGILAMWDRDTDLINKYWAMIPQEGFRKEILAFGQYPGTAMSSILYYIDNEIHHRGQAYVYLRALGIEPPMFWDRN